MEGLKRKRHLTYNSMLTYHEQSIRRVAKDWWGIDPHGLLKHQLIDMILDKQNKEEEGKRR